MAREVLLNPMTSMRLNPLHDLRLGSGILLGNCRRGVLGGELCCETRVLTRDALMAYREPNELVQDV